MKKHLKLSIVLVLLITTAEFAGITNLYGNQKEDSIKIWSSPDLENLTGNLVNAYLEENPAAQISAQSFTEGENIAQIPNNIGFITKEYFSDYDCKMAWRLAIGRDIIIPVTNPENPYLDEISQKGISPEEFRKLYTQTDTKNWGLLLGNNESSAINCWCLPDESTKAFLADFFRTNPSDIQPKEATDVEGLLTEIGNDKYALAFCRLANLIDPKTGEIDPRISLIPIDLNANNKVDNFEDIYANLGELERGAWIGKYPKELFTCVYAVKAVPPTAQQEKEFMQWVLTDGQDYLLANGYSELVNSERNSKLESLATPVVSFGEEAKKPIKTANILLFILIILTGLTGLVILILRKRPSTSGFSEEKESQTSGIFSEKSVRLQKGLFFDKTHTWAFMEKNGLVRTGIDDFIQHITGTITRVKMKNPGEKILKGQTYITLVQNGKQLEIKSPVTGIIKETNHELQKDATLLNKSPLSEGWVYTVETANWMKEVRAFLMGEAYLTWLKIEFTRFKDFLSVQIRPKLKSEYQIVMQDGGELKDGVLELFGPDLWEEFQTGFINNSK
jgi:glycine cleavage system H lipoate-binding protein/ABC-type phosphate transport system substrate-binding protein